MLSPSLSTFPTPAQQMLAPTGSLPVCSEFYAADILVHSHVRTFCFLTSHNLFPALPLVYLLPCPLYSVEIRHAGFNHVLQAKTAN